MDFSGILTKTQNKPRLVQTQKGRFMKHLLQITLATTTALCLSTLVSATQITQPPKETMSSSISTEDTKKETKIPTENKEITKNSEEKSKNNNKLEDDSSKNKQKTKDEKLQEKADKLGLTVDELKNETHPHTENHEKNSHKKGNKSSKLEEETEDKKIGQEPTPYVLTEDTAPLSS